MNEENTEMQSGKKAETALGEEPHLNHIYMTQVS